MARSVSPARLAAYEVVRRVFEQAAYADRALVTAAAGLDARDRALAQQIAYGTVQRVRALDHGIETLARRPVAKLDPPVRAALRTGAYQLAYLSGVARHAAVNETVELVRAARLERAVAFTNAVMRRLTVDLRDLLDALPEGPLKHSYPDWIADVWERDFGREAAIELMRAQNERPETVVRLVRGEPSGEPTDVPGAYRVERVDEQALAEGRVWPQSRGSQLAGLSVGSQPGERTLDLCAAPGGKATQLPGEVVAVEKNEGRARELAENVRRLGASNVRVVHADALELPSDLHGFDRALVDAPCSGLGVLNRRPDLRWRAEPLPDLQLALLRAAAERVRPGGTIVYSVCTLNADESETVVDASGLEIEDLGAEWPAFRHPSRPEFLLTLPHVHRTSGFFVARLRTRSSTKLRCQGAMGEREARTQGLAASVFVEERVQQGLPA
jgi:16S rRNA (cytosine967-C5)-methyltransferase